jgi:hypothetical protein
MFLKIDNKKYCLFFANGERKRLKQKKYSCVFNLQKREKISFVTFLYKDKPNV